MKVIYLAGPYRSSDGTACVKRNIDNAWQVARELWFMGFAAICPHLNTQFMNGPQQQRNTDGAMCGVTDNIFPKGELEQVSRRDIVVLLPGWEKSEGARGEAKWANQLGLPIFVCPGEKDKIQALLEA